MYLLILQRLALEAIFDVLYFPIWWYSGGASHALFWVVGKIKSGNARLAPGLWFRNMFVPMFGQYDWEGRIISFFMRFVQIVARSIALVVWLFICILLFVVYLIFPAVVLFGLGWSLVRL